MIESFLLDIRKSFVVMISDAKKLPIKQQYEIMIGVAYAVRCCILATQGKSYMRAADGLEVKLTDYWWTQDLPLPDEKYLQVLEDAWREGRDTALTNEEAFARARAHGYVLLTESKQPK